MSRSFPGGQLFVGHLRGGLGFATVAACAGFAAISGSSVATAATFATVAYPEMRRYGYPQSSRPASSLPAARLAPCCHLQRCSPSTASSPNRISASYSLPESFRTAGGIDGHADGGGHRPSAAGFPSRRAAPYLERAPHGSARHLGDAASVRLRDRRALWRLVHADGGGRRRGDRRASDRRPARPADAVGNPPLVAAGGADGGRGAHRADRRAAVRLFPHRDADAAERDCVSHRTWSRPLRRPGADHADVHRARLPDRFAGDDHPDHSDYFSGDRATRLRSDLVRRDHRDDRRTRTYSSARGDERVRHQERGAGSDLFDDLPRRAAVHRHRSYSAGNPDRLSDSGALAAVAHG